MIDRLLKLFISIIYHSSYKCLDLLCPLHKKQISNDVVVLTYHSIKKDQVKQFERQMDELLKVGSPVSLYSIDLNTDKKHLIGVSFDDGFLCQTCLCSLRLCPSYWA